MTSLFNKAKDLKNRAGAALGRGGGAAGGDANSEQAAPLTGDGQPAPGSSGSHTYAGRVGAVAGAAYAGAGAMGSVAYNAAGSSLARAQEAAKGRYEQLSPALASYVKEKVDVGQLRAVGFGAVGESLRQKRMEAKAALFDMTKPARARMLFGTRESVKACLVADPDMCMCVKRNVQDLVDLFWDDLTVYLETMVDDTKMAAVGRAETDVKKLAVLGEPPGDPLMKLRAWFLYHLLPFDISIFGQVKDPIFWLLTVISLLTFWGIRVMFFAFQLVMILLGRPADEYQLVCFILAFKGTQFISSGICMAVWAAAKYYVCIKPDGHHTCATDGPGATQDILSGAIDILGSCILVWVAFLCLPCSIRSAGMRDCADTGADQEAQTATCCGGQYDASRGGRLAKLLSYDLCCFLLSVGVLTALTYFSALQEEDVPGTPSNMNIQTGGEANMTQVQLVVEETNRWQFKSAVFFARVFYSILSFPFVVFMIPGLNGILTHTTATGYNPNGLCVPYYLHPVPKEE